MFDGSSLESRHVNRIERGSDISRLESVPPIFLSRKEKSAPLRLHAGWRWFSHEEEKNQPEYIEEKEIFGSRAASILEVVEKLENEHDTSPESWINAVRDAYSIYSEAIANQKNFDSKKRISDAFVMEEIFMPLIQRMEKIFEGESLEIKNELLEKLGEFAIEACMGEKEVIDEKMTKRLTISENPYTNPFTSECIITMVNIGGAESMEKVERLFTGLDELDKKLFKDYEKKYPLEPGDDYYYRFKFIHAVINEAIVKRDWGDDQAKQIAKSLSKLMLLVPTDGALGSLRYFQNSFEKLGVENSLPVLIENLKNEDQLTRKLSARILYSLEIGKISITDRGVKYFDTNYVLKKEGDPNFLLSLLKEPGAHVGRIGPNGEIGIHDGDGRLLGSFGLQLEERKKEIMAVVMIIGSKDFFLPKADETDEERKNRELMTEVLLSGYRDRLDRLFEETGVRLNSLELYEQGWFVLSYEEANEEEKKRLVNFVREYGDLGLKTFLVADYGGTAKDILDFAESSGSSKEEKLSVMEYFFKISNEAYQWRKSLENIEKNNGYNFAVEAHEAFIRKACEFFKAAMLIEKGQGEGVTMEKLQEAMRSVAYSLGVLRGLADESVPLRVESIEHHDGFLDEKQEIPSENVRTTWVLKEDRSGSRLVVTVRPEQTFAEADGSKGEGRINLKVVNKEQDVEMRIAFDMSTFSKEKGLEEEPRVSLDLGVGESYYRSGVYPTARLGEVLSLVERSEGGHNEASFSTSSSRRFGEVAKTFKDYMTRRFSAT